MGIPVIHLRGEILPLYESPENLLLFSEEPELCFKTLDLAAARDPSNPCITGVTCQSNACRLRVGLLRETFACFRLQSQI